MIFIGTDIVEVQRIRDLMDRWPNRFIPRIFTPVEIAYCSRQSVPAIHFAGRFAAKEAVKKALYAAGTQEPVLFSSITVDRTAEGQPTVNWNGDTTAALQVSISHTDHQAVATALAVVHD
ncbi:MAG: holo-ACP synthase [Candidatus Neomarinimicrobiota bacterium]